jgi:hypothetical protein
MKIGTDGIWKKFADTSTNSDHLSTSIKAKTDERSEGWIDYSAGYTIDYISYATAERGVYYTLDDWGLFSNGVTVTQLRHTFYQDDTHLWGTNTTFKFRIYAADGVTVLFTSPTLTANTSYTSGWSEDITTYTLPTPMLFTTDFIVTVIPVGTNGYPCSEFSSEISGASIISSTSPATSSSWSLNTGEFVQGVYIAGQEWTTLDSYTGTVAPGASKNINVHFDAADLNGTTKTANLIFVNNSNYLIPRGNNYAVPISLTVNLATTPIPYVNTPTWTTIAATGTPVSSGSVFTLKNVGIGTLTVSSITNLSATDFSTTFVPTGIALTANQTYAFGFTYHPSGPGVDNVTFNIVTSNGTVTVTLTGYGDYTLEGFNHTTFPPDGWANIDQDADTYKWYRYNAAGAAYSDSICAASESYHNDAKSNLNHNDTRAALTPDNYLITPRLAIHAGDVVKYEIGAQDPAWPAEHYSVKVSTTNANVSSFTTELFAETLVDGSWHARSIDLSAYAGQSIYLAFEHHAVTDEFILKLDDVLYPVMAAPLQYGSLTGHVYKSGTTTPIQNATVTINGLTATSDVNGLYTVANVLVGTYDATCAKPVGSYYFDQTITGVVISNGVPTTQNFGLTWAELGVSPTSFNVTVDPAGTADRNLTISNPGGTANLSYIVRLWDTSAKSASPTMATRRQVPDRTMTATLPANLKVQNSHTRTYGWYGYASTDDADIYTWAGTERATKYVLHDLGLLKPVTISQLTSFFYNPPTPATPWTSSNYHFVIYDADGTTVLYTSPSQVAVSLTETDYTLTTPLVVNNDFYVSVVPEGTSDSSPFTLGTDLYSGNSYYKSAGVWTLSTDEYLNYVYAQGAGWLTVTNGSGTVAPTGSAIVGLHFDAAGLSNTSRSCTIAVFNNSNNTSARGVTREIPVLFTITAGGIAAPTGVQVNLNGSNQPVISWAPVSGATSYKVYGSNDPYTSNWGTALATVSTSTSYTFTTGTLYHFFKITAVSGAKDNNETNVGTTVSKPAGAKK